MLWLIEQLGNITMKVFGIEDSKPFITEEMTMAPSEGRSYINYDNYDPTQQQVNRSEFDAAGESAILEECLDLPPTSLDQSSLTDSTIAIAS